MKSSSQEHSQAPGYVERRRRDKEIRESRHAKGIVHEKAEDAAHPFLVYTEAITQEPIGPYIGPIVPA